MKVLFAATRKNKDPLERELYEMDLMNEILGFERSLYDLGLLTIAACTPPEHEVRRYLKRNSHALASLVELMQ